MILEEKIGLTLSSRATLKVTTGAKTDSNCHASIEYPDPYTNWLVFCDIFVIVRDWGTVLQPHTPLSWFAATHETFQSSIEDKWRPKFRKSLMNCCFPHHTGTMPHASTSKNPTNCTELAGFGLWSGRPCWT